MRPAVNACFFTTQEYAAVDEALQAAFMSAKDLRSVPTAMGSLNLQKRPPLHRRQSSGPLTPFMPLCSTIKVTRLVLLRAADHRPNLPVFGPSPFLLTTYRDRHSVLWPLATVSTGQSSWHVPLTSDLRVGWVPVLSGFGDSPTMVPSRRQYERAQPQDRQLYHAGDAARLPQTRSDVGQFSAVKPCSNDCKQVEELRRAAEALLSSGEYGCSDTSSDWSGCVPPAASSSTGFHTPEPAEGAALGIACASGAAAQPHSFCATPCLEQLNPQQLSSPLSSWAAEQQLQEPAWLASFDHPINAHLAQALNSRHYELPGAYSRNPFAEAYLAAMDMPDAQLELELPKVPSLRFSHAVQAEQTPQHAKLQRVSRVRLRACVDMKGQ